MGKLQWHLDGVSFAVDLKFNMKDGNVGGFLPRASMADEASSQLAGMKGVQEPDSSCLRSMCRCSLTPSQTTICWEMVSCIESQKLSCRNRKCPVPENVKPCFAQKYL